MNFNMKKIMEKAKQMQEQMEKSKQELDSLEVSAESGAGLVKITLNGKYRVKSLDIDKDMIKEDKEFLEDLISSAINLAVEKVEEAKEKMSSPFAGMTGGMNFPF